MRLLIYGMQSSGATAFTQVLAQRPDCVALVDIPNNYAAPRVTTGLNFVAKVVVTTAYPLTVHVERFLPDKVILLLRDPRDNYASLKNKSYRHYSGLMSEKFRLLDQLFEERERFDGIVHYEDLVARAPTVIQTLDAVGWPILPSYFNFNRSYNELLGRLWAAEPRLQEEMEVVFGNARGSALTDRFQQKRDPQEEILLEELCPRLLAYYRRRENAPMPG